MALVGTETYQRITGDTAGDPTAALAEAQSMVDEYCHRTFEYAASVSETLTVNSWGLVYPTHTPIISVASPAGALMRMGGIHVGQWAGEFNVLSPLPPQVTVTYAGGYLPYGTANPASPVVPAKLARVICRIAYLSAHPVVLAGVPAGVKSVSLGDVSLSSTSALSPFLVMDSSIESDLQGFVRPRLGAGARQ